MDGAPAVGSGSKRPDPLLLALDTATRRASVALCRGATLLAEGAREVTTHSEGLMPLIDEILTRAAVAPRELDALVCGRGPGSFTGLRIGMATAKGLCLAADLPLVCVSSLLPLALAVREARGGEPLVLTLLDARRGEVYGARYRGAVLEGEERVLPPGEVALLAAGDEPLLLAGDGALAHRDALLEALGPLAALAPEGCHQIEARHLCPEGVRRLAAGQTDDLGRAVPVYIRPSDAKLPAIPQDRRMDDLLPLELARESRLRLDRDGRWWHEGTLVQHQRLAAALHRWLDRLDDGRYVVRLDEARYAYVEVEDAPYLVRTLDLSGEEQVRLTLSDGSEETLAPATLAVGGDDALYCRVKGGRFEARFSRAAHNTLAQQVEEDGESGFALRLGSRLWPVGRRP